MDSQRFHENPFEDRVAQALFLAEGRDVKVQSEWEINKMGANIMNNADNRPLMPRATAIWLIDNTALTFEQIANFCGLHIFEVESLADSDETSRMQGFDPIMSSQLTAEEIKRCEADTKATLQLKAPAVIEEEKKTGKGKYTPKAKRQDKPDAIFWLVKYYPEMSDQDICALLGTTKITIHSIRNKTHRNMAEIKARSPVALGLCSETDLEFAISKLTRK